MLCPRKPAQRLSPEGIATRVGGVAMDHVVAYIDELKTVPTTRISCAWYTTLLLTFFIVIFGLIAAHEEDHANGNQGAGFGAIWSLFLLCAIGYGGTYVLRKARAPLSLSRVLWLIHAVGCSSCRTPPRRPARRWPLACCSDLRS